MTLKSGTYVEIEEEPLSSGARFRYKNESRHPARILGAHWTAKQPTYPSIKICGYRGPVGVCVSLVTADGPLHFPHPHKLVGPNCDSGVYYKENKNCEMSFSFPDLRIEYVKRREVKDSLDLRAKKSIDPYQTGYFSDVKKIDFEAVRLCYEVLLPDLNGKLCIRLPPVKSKPIFNKRTVSDLDIIRLSHCSATAAGGQQIILLCTAIHKNDIQVIFYEEIDGTTVWSAPGIFSPTDVHCPTAIVLKTPAYRNPCLQRRVQCFVQLKRPSDGAKGKPKEFGFLPERGPGRMIMKHEKFEAMSVLQQNTCSVDITKMTVRTESSYENGAVDSLLPGYDPGHPGNPYATVCRNDSEEAVFNVASSNAPQNVELNDVFRFPEEKLQDSPYSSDIGMTIALFSEASALIYIDEKNE